MVRAITPVAALLLGVAILLIGQGLQGVLLPVRATLESFSTMAIGLIGGTYFLGFTIGCWKGTRLIQRAGHVRVFAAMTAIASASPLLIGLWVNLWSWGILRFLTGFCFAVLFVVIESWLNEKATNENRGQVFSAYILINMTMLAVGQQMLLLDDPLNLQLFALTSVLVSLAAVPVVMSVQVGPREIECADIDFGALYRNSPAGMAGSFTSGLNNGAFWALAPVFTAAFTDDVQMAAAFMTAVVLGGACGQWPLGWWSDRMDRRIVLIGICVLGLAISAATWLLAPHLPAMGLLGMGFLWGAMAFPTYSIAVAHANDWAEPDTFVQISASLLLLYGAGAIVGPFLASGLMSALGGAGLFLYTAVTFALLALYVGGRMFSRDAVADEDQTNFSDALTSARTVSVCYEEEMETEESQERLPLTGSPAE